MNHNAPMLIGTNLARSQALARHAALVERLTAAIQALRVLRPKAEIPALLNENPDRLGPSGLDELNAALSSALREIETQIEVARTEDEVARHAKLSEIERLHEGMGEVLRRLAALESPSPAMSAPLRPPTPVPMMTMGRAPLRQTPSDIAYRLKGAR